MDISTRMRYWETFADFITRESIGLRFRGPYESTSKELLFNVGGGEGIELRAWMDEEKDRIEVMLYLTGSEKQARFNSLESMRDEINGSFKGEDLEWRQPISHTPRTPNGSIALIRRDTNLENRGDWDTQHKWLAEMLVRFDEVFRPIVPVLKAM